MIRLFVISRGVKYNYLRRCDEFLGIVRQCHISHRQSILLKGDRQIPVSSADLAAQSRDVAIPGEQTKSSLRM